MRTNIFPHFINRDSRQIAGLFTFQNSAKHRAWIKAGLNASAILCEDYCLFPPGFIIECDITFSVLEEQYTYLEKGLIATSLRGEYLPVAIEKKRGEYALERDLYPGIFDDNRVDFITEKAWHLIPRKFGAGEEIADAWKASIDSNAPIWKQVQKQLGLDLLKQVSTIPGKISDEGLAATWAAIVKRLPEEAKSAGDELRSALQHVYFKAYMEEYGLNIVKDIPYITNNFGLRPRERKYSFRKLMTAMNAFHLGDIVGVASANSVLELRTSYAFIQFIDNYVQVAKLAKSESEISYIFSTAEKRSNFDWERAQTRRARYKGNFELLDVAEEVSALDAANSWLAKEYNFSTRSELLKHRRQHEIISTVGHRRKVPHFDNVVVVAAFQELNYIREYCKKIDLDLVATDNIGKVLGDTFKLETSRGDEATTALVLAREKGKAGMQELVGNIMNQHRPEKVILVGMMAGFKGKCNLLDVVIPTAVYDVTRVGIKEGKIAKEPEPELFSPYVLDWLLKYDRRESPLILDETENKLIVHKKTLGVGAKYEDLYHQLAQEAMDIDRENIIGLEMEGAALASRQRTKALYQETAEFVMIKGVADYAGEKVDKEESTKLQELFNHSTTDEEIDPIKDSNFREILQRAATERAMEVTIRVLKECL